MAAITVLGMGSRLTSGTSLYFNTATPISVLPAVPRRGVANQGYFDDFA